MAKSLLRQQLEAAAPDGDLGWDRFSAALETLLTAISGVTLGASDAAATPGSNASKAIAVQGVANAEAIVTTPALNAYATFVTLSNLLTTDATVPGDSLSTAIAVSSDFTGTIAGGTVSADSLAVTGLKFTWNATDISTLLESIGVVCTTGSFVWSTVRID